MIRSIWNLRIDLTTQFTTDFDTRKKSILDLTFSDLDS